MSLISEISVMDDIFSMEKNIEEKTGIHITNVSHWDSSIAFKEHMNKVLLLPPSSLPWDYYYTYSFSIEDRYKVLKKLGVQSKYLKSTAGVLYQSSTIAIVNMINFLVNHNRKKLCILQPSYFSVSSCCSMLSLEYNTEQIMFVEGTPKIPVEKILKGGYDCIWITSPIYGTSHYYDETQLKDIAHLKKSGLMIIFDESLALPGYELLRFFPIDKNTFAIYSPHKSISINGLKFAVMVCNEVYEEFLDQWVDVFSGAFACSNRDAVLHYISPNFLKMCFPAYKAYINKTEAAVAEVIRQFPFATILPNSNGHYINIFIDLKLQDSDELFNLITSLAHECFTSFIPGTLSGFDKTQNLCFRVNLTGDINDLPYAVGRILMYLKNNYYLK